MCVHLNRGKRYRGITTVSSSRKNQFNHSTLGGNLERQKERNHTTKFSRSVVELQVDLIVFSKEERTNIYTFMQQYTFKK